MEEDYEVFFKDLDEELSALCNESDIYLINSVIFNDEAHYSIVDDTFDNSDRIRVFYIKVTPEGDGSYTVEIAEPVGREKFNTLAEFSSSDSDECLDKIVEVIS